MGRRRIVLAAVSIVAIASMVGACGRSLPPTTAGRGSLERAIHYTPDAAGRLRQARNELIAQCMRDHGYLWWPPPRDPHLLSSPHGLFELETPDAVRSYRLEFGYGVVEQVFVMQQAGRQLARIGPQDAYFHGLDRQARAAYREALTGGPRPGDGDGCAGRAERATGGAGALGDDAPLVGAYGKAIHDYLSDPRVRRIEADVMACMRGSGFDYSSEGAIVSHFQLELKHLVGGVARFDGDGNLHFSWGPDGLETLRIPRESLDRIRDEELATARTEVMCRDTYSGRLGKLLGAYTAPVLADFGPEIREAARAYEQIEEGVQG